MKKTAIDVLTSTPALPPDVVADADHDPFFPSMYPSEAYDTLERLTMRLPRYNFSGGGELTCALSTPSMLKRHSSRCAGKPRTTGRTPLPTLSPAGLKP